MTIFRGYEHVPTPNPSFRETRRDTLNFELCGGEPHSHDEVELDPIAKMYHFPAKVARRVVTSTRTRKEDVMTSQDNAAGDSREDTTQDRHERPWQRKESFSTTRPVQVNIVTRSGDVTVLAHEGQNLEVTLSAGSSKYEYSLDVAEITFDAESGYLDIRSQPHDFDGSLRSLSKAVKKSWFDFGSSDPDVIVVVPVGSSLDAKTMSGNISIHGSLGEVNVSSISGDVLATDSCDALAARTTSGDVNTGRARDVLKCHSVSGDIKCLGVASRTEINSASGDIAISADQPGNVTVKSVSGDVKVRVARGLAVDINGNSISGDLGTNIDLDATGDAKSDEEVITIKITTVSGDIRIDKAS
jgi:DUF4097 and DUF4098 domain-containing protein YvlB